MNEKFIIAQRGRPNAQGLNTQRLEPRFDGIANTLTTVQKDNYVMEVKKLTTRGTDIASTIRATIYKQGSRNLIENYTSGLGYEGVLEMGEGIRIRKLTPKECWRLMGFADEDFEEAEKVNSNTQLYKQAGNSIVVPVFENILAELFKCGVLGGESDVLH